MTSAQSYVIVGAGMAGAKTAEALRDAGFDGRVTLLGAEAHRPYDRPSLSKDYLQGTYAQDKLFVHSEGWYDEHQVDLRVATTVTAVDRGAQQLTTSAGDRIAYDRLVLATGSSPRRLTIPGADLDGVLYLRTLDDSDRIREAIRPGARVVVIGGGWIGLETAAAARSAGAHVTVLERSERPLLRVLGPRVAPVFSDLHRDHGVDLRCLATVSAIRRGAGHSVGAVTLMDGSQLTADLVIVGIGATPTIDLARTSGLAVSGGVVVDAQLRTSDAHVHAVGDIADAYHPVLGRRLRIEHWASAVHQPAVAAKAMMGGADVYSRLPYFYSDQFDLGMEYTGYVAPDDDPSVVIRGDLQRREFIAFWLRGGRVLAGMNVNIWDVAEDIRALIDSKAAVDLDRLADPDVPLGELVA